MTKRNLLILMSDEHSRGVSGCYGDPIARTPNIDALAARGTRFTKAYTPSPICVPARAAIATGRPVHETGHWDNAHPYEGKPMGWAHILRDAGHEVVSIGKLHYRSAEVDAGFTEQILPMHVENGIGDIAGSIRSPLPVRAQSRQLAENLGPGETSYTRYDRAVRDAACEWLCARTSAHDGWVLLVSFVAPHFPLVAPQEFYDLYADAELYPAQPDPDDSASHPWLTAMRGSYVYDNFDDERRREALRSYYGLVSFLDANIGSVLQALGTSGVAGSTDILYLSDHGDNLGERGMWGKSTFFEESVGVPVIYAAADCAMKPRTCATPVSLTDLHDAVLDIMLYNGSTNKGFAAFSRQPEDLERPVLSQYHAAGSPSSAFMLRKGRFKYCEYVGYAPQLFDLETDPFERHDLVSDNCHRTELEALRSELVQTLGKSPESIDIEVRAAQSRLVQLHGGPGVILSGTPLTATSVPKPAFPK